VALRLHNKRMSSKDAETSRSYLEIERIRICSCCDSSLTISSYYQGPPGGQPQYAPQGGYGGPPQGYPPQQGYGQPPPQVSSRSTALLSLDWRAQTPPFEPCRLTQSSRRVTIEHSLTRISDGLPAKLPTATTSAKTAQGARMSRGLSRYALLLLRLRRGMRVLCRLL